MPEGTTIRAAVCRGVGGPQSIEELVLAAPGPGEVRVRVDACAVCHSDLMYVDGGWATDFPLVMGHEAAGRVLELGAGVDDLAVGDPVVVVESMKMEIPVEATTAGTVAEVLVAEGDQVAEDAPVAVIQAD